MAIIRKIVKIGDSLAITIPAEIRKHLDIKRGEYVVWAIGKKNRVIVEKLSPKKHPGFFLPGTGWI